MPLAGHQLLPREIAEFGHAHGWTNEIELTKMVATCLGESQGFIGANHLNGDPPSSEDCGLMQISIMARDIGGPVEKGLMTTSKDREIWVPVVNENIRRGRNLYEARKWQPWYAYTLGWATFPSWWVWHQENLKPIGPWMRTGRYIHRALVGVANFHVRIAKDKSLAEGVVLAETLASHFRVEGTLGTSSGYVNWTHVPPEPIHPPPDGVGPRPIPNTGQ